MKIIQMQHPQISPNSEELINILAQVTHSLNIDDLSFSSYSSAISQLSTELLSLETSLNRMRFVEEELQAHLASTMHEQRLLDKWTTSMENGEGIGENPVLLERKRDALKKKAKEYHAELTAITASMPGVPPITVTQLTEQQNKVKTKEQQLRLKRAKMKTFEGLPPNLDLARLELRKARDEQAKLVQLRERLLGKMTEGVS